MTTVRQDELLGETSGAAIYDSDEDYYDDDDDDEERNEHSDDQAEDGETIDRPSRISLLLEELTKSVQTALDSLSRKTASLERELAKALTLEETMKRANLIVSNIYR